MMAMTIFMGSAPRLGPPCGSRVDDSLACALSREISLSPSNAAATNQAPCQFAPSAVSDWKQKAFAERPRPACDLLSSAAQTPLKPAQFLIRRCEGTECPAWSINARNRLRGIAGAHVERGHAPPANYSGGRRTVARGGSGVRLRLLQRFAVLGQIEAFDLVRLAHPQRDEQSDHLEENVGQHAGPDDDRDDGVELD
jgi:hypothetical protein